MYLNGRDYQTVWQLAHIWCDKDSHASNPNDLMPDVKEVIYRILVAIRNDLISARTHKRVILKDTDTIEFLIELRHYLKLNACLKNNRFDKEYLDSLYVWRPEVIRWCNVHQLPLPPVWQLKLNAEFTAESEADDENGDWYTAITPRRKRIMGALHIAARLWEENKLLSYEDIWNHEDMKKYDKPRSFTTLDSFKEWARDIAPPEAKLPGKRKKSVV